MPVGDVPAMSFAELMNPEFRRERMMRELQGMKMRPQPTDNSWRGDWLQLQRDNLELRREAEGRRRKGQQISRDRLGIQERGLKIKEAMAPFERALKRGQIDKTRFGNELLKITIKHADAKERAQIRKLGTAAARDKVMSDYFRGQTATEVAKAGASTVGVNIAGQNKKRRVDKLRDDLTKARAALKAAWQKAGTEVKDVVDYADAGGAAAARQMRADAVRAKKSGNVGVAKNLEAIANIIENLEREGVKEPLLRKENPPAVGEWMGN